MTIYPDSFPSSKENPATWDEGYSFSFPYSTKNEELPPIQKSQSSVKLLADLQSTSITIDMQAIASAYTCSDVVIVLSTNRSIQSNDLSSQVFVYNETHRPGQTQTVVIDKLLPCIPHHLEILQKSKHGETFEIYSQNFKTLQTFDGMNDTLLSLEENEVVLSIVNLENNKLDFDKRGLVLEWADRCLDEYKIKLCRIPLECLYEDSVTVSTIFKVKAVIRF